MRFCFPLSLGWCFLCSDVKTDVKKLQAGFKKFNYEAEFVKETKQDGKKDGKQESKKEDKKADKK